MKHKVEKRRSAKKVKIHGGFKAMEHKRERRKRG